MKSAVGDFLIQTTDVVTDTIAVTGLGFIPKVLILFWTGRSDAVDALGRADGHIGFSVCTATTERRVTAGKNEDAQATTDTDRYGLATAIVANISETISASAGLADLFSFDADGFTVVIDEVFGRDLRISFLALAGTDITAQVVQDFVSQNVLGTQAVTGVGFQPDFLLWHALGSGTGLPIGPGGNLQLTIAGMISAAQQGNWAAQARSGQGTSDANRHAENVEAFMTVGSGGGVNNRFEFDSMDADGFTVDHLEADDDRVNFLAMQGGDYAIGQLLTRTDGADIVVTGLGFKPAAILFVSHTEAEDAVNVSRTNGVMSVGAAVSPTDRQTQYYSSVDGLGTSRVNTAIEFDEVYIRTDQAAAPAITGLMDLKSIDADGFTCVMDNPDPSAAFVLFFAFGPAEAPPAAPSGLVCTTFSPSRIDLVWVDNSTDEDGFRIERAPLPGGPFAGVGSVGAGVTSFSDMGLPAATPFSYRVIAFNAAGDSVPSNVDTCTTDPTPPGPGRHEPGKWLKRYFAHRIFGGNRLGDWIE